MLCAKCGGRIAEGEKYCRKCFAVSKAGSVVLWKKCPTCGFTVTDDEKYCRSCGKYIKYDTTDEAEGGINTFAVIMITFFVMLLGFCVSYIITYMNLK